MKIKPGDKLPHNDFFYLDDANEVKIISTSDLFKAQKIILLGMPGAFTKTCSAIHLPGYVKNYELALKKGIKKIICIAVNDPNVMKAWGQNQNVNNKILMVGDPFCKFAKWISHHKYFFIYILILTPGFHYIWIVNSYTNYFFNSFF